MTHVINLSRPNKTAQGKARRAYRLKRISLSELKRLTKANKLIAWNEKQKKTDQEWIKIYSLLHPCKSKEFWTYICRLGSTCTERRNLITETRWLPYITSLYNPGFPNRQGGLSAFTLKSTEEHCNSVSPDEIKQAPIVAQKIDELPNIVKRSYEENLATRPHEEDAQAPEGSNASVTCREPTEVNIMAILSKIRRDGAPGPNGLPGSLFREDCTFWSERLAPIFQHCFQTGTVPASWRGSILHPIHKKGDPLDPSNYRLIALLVIEGKAYASFLLQLLTTWVEKQGQLPFYQTGFRAKASTIDNIVALSYLSHQARLGQSRPLYCCFIDYLSAFDGVDRGKLWAKLETWGIEDNLLKAIKSLYEETWVRMKLSPKTVSAKIATGQTRMRARTSPF